MKIDVIYERDVRFTKWPAVNYILGGWYAAAAIAVALLCLPALSLGMLMTGKAAGTLLKRVGALYERIIG